MQEKYSDGRLKQIGYVDTLVEELRMFGFDAKTVSNELSDWIECDSVAGTIKYKPMLNVQPALRRQGNKCTSLDKLTNDE